MFFVLPQFSAFLVVGLVLTVLVVVNSLSTEFQGAFL